MNDHQTDDLFELPERNAYLINYFMTGCSDVGARRHLQRVLDCGKFHLLFISPEGFRITPQYCNSRWCQKCAHERARSMAVNLTSQLMNLHVQRESKVGGVSKRWMEKVSKDDLRHFVFTIQSENYFKLRHILDRFRVALRQISKMLQADDAVYVWKIEITFKKYHVHPHIHLAVNRYYPIDYIHEFWRRNIRPFNSKIKFATKVKCSMFEFCKYTTKPESWINIDENNFQYIWFALKRRRVIGTSRHLKLLPQKNQLGWKPLGSLEFLAQNSNSEFQGVAIQLLDEMKNKINKSNENHKAHNSKKKNKSKKN